MFVITSNPASRGRRWTSPVWWSESARGVVGTLRTGEAAAFSTVDEALACMRRVPLADVRFFDLAVVDNPAVHDLTWQSPRRF